MAKNPLRSGRDRFGGIVKTTKKSVIYAGAVLGLLISTSSLAQVQQLPISSFLNAQAPLQVQFWSDPVTGGLLGFDVFGKRNATLGLNLGTSVSGSVVIRDLGNGTELVTVDVHAQNAACWGFVGIVPAFGRTPAEIAAGAPASLGDGHVRFVFTQPTGNPLPTWNVIAFGGPPIVLETVITDIICQGGELRAGSGFPEGTSGFAQTTQTGLLSTGVPAGCPPEKDGDCFPAEKVQFKPNGT
jgi:hypothetical protein